MVRISNPYEKMAKAKFRLRGNLHAHSNLSDGVLEPQQVIDAYAGQGYGFLEMSDHDQLADSIALERYDSRGMVLIPGNEITSGGPHILHVNARALVAPESDRQKVIREVGRTGGFAIVNHPDWLERFDHCPIADMALWQGYTGMEIYNGVIGRLPGSPYALDKWDMLLSAARRVWGFANDDFHKPEDLALGWNVVFCDARSPDAIAAAMAAGAFYASTGVVISAVTVAGSRVTVETENAHKVVAVIDWGRRIAQNRGGSLTVEVPANAHYMRFDCYGAGEERAWTQPFFVEG
jgi:hypothetical protein